MAKIPFTKLKCKIEENIKEVSVGEDIVIEIKQYLPIQKKLELIGNVIMYAHEQDANYSNPVKAAVIRDIEVVFAYTNIAFTEKQKEDIPKLYDLLKSSGVLNIIISNIPIEEYVEIVKGVEASIKSVYEYQNSAVGIIDTLKNKSDDLNINIEELINSIENPESLGTLKTIIEEII